MPHSLPFLIVHGEIIAWSLIPLCVIAAWVRLWRRQVRAAQRRMADARRRLGSPTPGERFHPERSATVEGALRFDDPGEAEPAMLRGIVDWGPRGAPPRRAEFEGPVARIDGVIETDGGSLSVSGPALLECGSEFDQLGDFLRSRLRSGERVRLAGTLEAVSGGEEAGYRDAAMEWRLVGTVDCPLRVAAAGAPRGAGPGWGSLASVGVGVGLCTLLISAAVGAVALGVARAGVDERPGLEFAGSPGLQLAAALPSNRGRALQELRDELARDQNAGEATTAALVELSIADGNCAGAIMIAVDRGQWLWPVAEECSESRAVLNSRFVRHYRRGEFEAASALLLSAHVFDLRNPAQRVVPTYEEEPFQVDWRFAAMVHWLAGNYESAAAVLRDEASRLRWPASYGPALVRTERDEREDRQRATVLDCTADVICHLGRGDMPSADLYARAEESAECKLLVTGLLDRDRPPPPFEDEQWHAISSYHGRHLRELVVAERLPAAFDGRLYCADCLSSFAGGKQFAAGRSIELPKLHLGLLLSAAESLRGEDSPTLAQVERIIGFEFALLGEPERAMAALLNSELAAVRSDRMAGSELVDTLALLAAVSSAYGDVETARESVERLRLQVEATNDDEFAELLFAEEELDFGQVARARSSRERRLALLSNVLWDEGTSEEASAAAARAFAISAEWHGWRTPGSWLGTLARGHRLAKLYGDDAWAKELAPARKAWLEALEDRDRSFVLGFLGYL